MVELRQRLPRVVSEKHCAFIRRLPCLISGAQAECAHIRYSDARHGKFNPGVGARPDDCWVIPLSPYWHREGPESQHVVGDERKFWERHGIDPCEVAKRLWEISGDVEAGRVIIKEFMP